MNIYLPSKSMNKWSCWSSHETNQLRITSSYSKFSKNAVFNNRPLTWISNDVTDLVSLTYNQFLIGNWKPRFTFNTSNETDIDVRKQWMSSKNSDFNVLEVLGARIIVVKYTSTKLETTHLKIQTNLFSFSFD